MEQRLTPMSSLIAVPDSGAPNRGAEVIADGEKQQPLFSDVGLIAFVPDAWEDLWQSRHHVISRLARYFQVVWVDPHGRTGADRCDLGEGVPASPGSGFMVYRPGFWRTRSYHLPWLDDLLMHQKFGRARKLLTRRGCKKIILYIWRPTLLPCLEGLIFDLSCYHIDDEYGFSPVELPLSDAERRMILAADQVFLHSLGLLEKKGRINPHTMFVPNGVDYQAYSRQVPEPLDL